MNVPEDNMNGRDELSHEDEDVEYERFVRSLTDMVGDLDDLGNGGEADEASFHGSENEEEEDEDDGKDIVGGSDDSMLRDIDDMNALDQDGIDLETELEMLLQEDLESALKQFDLPLLVLESEGVDGDQSSSSCSKPSNSKGPQHLLGLHTPLRDKYRKHLQLQNKDGTKLVKELSNDKQKERQQCSDNKRQSNNIIQSQIEDLRDLLSRHFQLLIQQAVLATRSAAYHQEQSRKSESIIHNHSFPFPSRKESHPRHSPNLVSSNYVGIESTDELAEILDSSVGMLQELDQNRKDAIRKSIQNKIESDSIHHRSGNESSFPHSDMPNNSIERKDEGDNDEQNNSQRRFTRAAFRQTLQLREAPRVDDGSKIFSNDIRQTNVTEVTHAENSRASIASTSINDDLRTMSVFDMKGLSKLKSAFLHLDKCSELGLIPSDNILTISSHKDACKCLLRMTGAETCVDLIPGRDDLSAVFSNLPNNDLLKNDDERNLKLMQDRELFTASEDNLILRGVNLFGEKEWALISERFLPGRTSTLINQRHSSLTIKIFRNNGIKIDDDGCLTKPPEFPDGLPYDVQIKMKALKVVTEPNAHNVHRWSLEEDLTLLKSVAIVGRHWAEISNNFIKHRDRGHLRKRYQVLERRVKGVTKREVRKKSSIPLARSKVKEKQPDKKIKKKASRKRAEHPAFNPFVMPPMQIMNGMPFYPMPGMPGVQIPMQMQPPGQSMPLINGPQMQRDPNKILTKTGATPKKYEVLQKDSPERDKEFDSSTRNKNLPSLGVESPGASNSAFGFQRLLDDQWSNMSNFPAISNHAKSEVIETDGLEGSKILTSLSLDSPSMSRLSCIEETKDFCEDKKKSKSVAKNGAERTKALFDVITRAAKGDGNKSMNKLCTAVAESIATPESSPTKKINQFTPSSHIPHVDTMPAYNVSHVEFSNIQFTERSRIELKNGQPQSNIEALSDDDLYDSALLLSNLGSPSKQGHTQPSSPNKGKRKRYLFPDTNNAQTTSKIPKRSLFESAIGSIKDKNSNSKRKSVQHFRM